VTGGVLGVSPDWTYGHRTVPLPENSILALFTDGITEASRQPDAAEDGGVGVLLARDRARPAARLVRSILDAAAAAASGHLQDDVALVVVKRLPAERLPASLEEPRVAGSFLELMHTHELLDALFARHQEALLGSDIDQARELLRRYERELNAHMRVEEDLLLPVYERAGRVAGGPPEFYTGEHQRMREFVGRFHESLDELALNPPEAPQRVIALLDQQAIYKHLVEHHDLREQNLLYPILDRVTADSERAELMARALAPPREGARA
jgi:hemerythrin-like domain-containing protein